MPDPECLNCGQRLQSHYCVSCGQEAGTKRFSLKNIFSIHFFLGLLSLERGFFFTIKALFSRPGHAVRDYVQGKRIKYLHYFNLLIILITLGIILDGFSHISIGEIIGTIGPEGLNKFEKFVAEYPKVYTLLSIPLFAIITIFWFKASKQNFAEHLVLNSYRGAGEMVIGFAFTGLAIFIEDLDLLRRIYPPMSLGLIMYEIIFYYQYFKPFYKSKAGLFLRSFGAALSLALVILAATFL